LFRLAAASDFEAIAAIANHYIRQTAVHFGDRDVPAAEMLELWQRHEDVYPWLVTIEGGAVAGFAKAGEFRTRAAYRWTTEVGIYLAAEKCGQGLGAPLYARLVDMLRAQGFHSAIGGITLPNPASVRLHEKLGFRHWGTTAHAGWKFGAWHDVGFWQLMLQPEGHEAGPLLPPARAFAATA
jgi:phosphinothricin acetyltransferase